MTQEDKALRIEDLQPNLDALCAGGVQPPVSCAAYWDGAEEWEKLAWHLCAEENGEDACGELIWESGPTPEPWGDRWLKYEGEARRMIALVRTHVPAPKQAAPDQSVIKEAVGKLHMLLMPVPAAEVTALEVCKVVSERAMEIINLLQQVAQEPSSNLLLAVIGHKHFGNPIPKEWYAAARDLEAAHGITGGQHGAE